MIIMKYDDDESITFYSMENKGESLPSPISSGSSGKKSSRKEEQYRLMFSELEKYVVAHSSNSNKHYAVLECLMQVRVSFNYYSWVIAITIIAR